jgi:pyruvate dehydrogenase E1 component
MAAQPDPLRTFALNDSDSQETREWMDALSAVIASEGPERAHYLLEQLLEHARENSIDMPFSANTGHVNTLEPEQEERCPGNIEIEERLRAYMRWNAMAMVVKANRHNPADGGDLGGHIGSFASLAHMFGAGFNHFWHAESENHGGDLLYIQGHVSPGVYARAYLEGRLSEEQLLNFRQEVDGKGLSSYPHPKLMPEFWQFPTVSMGLGPLMAIYLLAMRLPKMEYVGTAAVFFLLLNLYKVPFMISLGLITPPSFTLNLWLAPAVLAGAWLGRRILPRINQKVFENLALFFSAAAGLRLLF